MSTKSYPVVMHAFFLAHMGQVMQTIVIRHAIVVKEDLFAGCRDNTIKAQPTISKRLHNFSKRRFSSLAL